MKVSIFDKQSILKINNKKVEKQINIILKNEKISTDEVILNFVDNKIIKELHLKYFNDHSTTDCISFPIDSPKNKKTPHHILGEAFINTQEAIKCSKKYKITVFEELTLYVIHCVLHLIGYDDINKDDIKIMREKENFYLSLLKEKKLL